jgi:hypothetical protein
MCTCAACTSAVNLSLKIITHYGEFSSYTVKDFSKLIGKDVIVAHQLLKNDIDLHEYWLATNNLFPGEKKTEQLPEWLQWQHGNKQTENGNISFNYSLLTPLKENIEPALPLDRTLGENKIKVASVTKTINAEIIRVFSVMGNLQLRNKWQVGVKSIDKINHPIYHLGIRFRAITDKGSTVFYSSSFSDANNMFCLSETDENKTQSIYVTLKPLAENKTSVTLDLYLPRKSFTNAIFSLFMKRKVVKDFKQSLNNLEKLLTDK